MSRFASAAEVEGTRNDALATRGIYRYSRNPQYLGYVVALGGAAVGRRSLTAAGLTAAIAGAYALWVPVEEHQVEVLYGEDYRRYVREVRRWWAAGDVRLREPLCTEARRLAYVPAAVGVPCRCWECPGGDVSSDEVRRRPACVD